MVIYYKSIRLINGKPKWVLKDENYNIVLDPTKEQIKLAIDEKYRPKKCCICKNDKTYVDSSGNHHWYGHKCNKKDCTRWSCEICYLRESSPAGWRHGVLDPNSPSGKGFIGARIVIKTLGAEDCNIKMDNFNFYVDLSKYSGYGIGEVKTATLNIVRGEWGFNIRGKWGYDTLFLVCMDEKWKDVERIYIIPCEEAVHHGTSIAIVKNSSRITWYEEFRVDEKSFNSTYHNMNLENCHVLRKRQIIGDVKMVDNIAGIKKLLSQAENAEIRMGFAQAADIGLDFSDNSITKMFDNGIAIDIVIKNVGDSDYLPTMLQRYLDDNKKWDILEGFVNVKIMDNSKDSRSLGTLEVIKLLADKIPEKDFKFSYTVEDPQNSFVQIRVISVQKNRFLNLKEIESLLFKYIPMDEYELTVEEL